MPYDIRPDHSEYNEYYRRYVAHVPDGNIVTTLGTQLDGMLAMLGRVGDEQAMHAYAPGKWSIKEVVGHITDAERVFAYRALRFARGDGTPLATFDENDYVPAGRFGDRNLAGLLDEFAAVRHATVRLFAGLPEDAWTRTGIASGYGVSVRALAWITAGHELHHRHILATRYLQTDAGGTSTPAT
ncbi:MAG TPA: DinB family protein [Longimicrobiales bacterium]|nr:DinB family protein [Longimicrobiales bacterium]